MKAAKLTEHPSFRLMRQTDVQNVWHMQMPRWLFSDPRYADMSLDAKVTYILQHYCIPQTRIKFDVQCTKWVLIQIAEKK